MKLIQTKRLRASKSGFSLVEVTLALGISSFCLISLMAMLPLGVNTNRESTQKTHAAMISSMIVGDLKTSFITGTNPITSPVYDLQLPATGSVATTSVVFLDEGGVAIGNVDSDGTIDSRYRATITITPPAANTREPYWVHILMTWPALADRQAATDPTNFSGSYEFMTALYDSTL